MDLETSKLKIILDQQSPPIYEDKSLVACVELFEYESAPAKHNICKHIAYITTGYEGTQTSFLHNQFEQKN